MSDWHEVSDDGRYVIGAAHVVDRFRFTASLLVPEPGKRVELLGTFDSAHEARQVCEKYEEQLTRRSA